MNISACIVELENRLAAVPGLRVIREGQAEHPPCAYVSLPAQPLRYDRVMDETTVEVVALCGPVKQWASRGVATAYADRDGPRSVYTAIQAGQCTAFDVAKVLTSEFEFIRVRATPGTPSAKPGETNYLAVIFTVELKGQGGL